MQINFTGKNQLTNDEFIDFYDELWKRTPHYTINWPSNDEISRIVGKQAAKKLAEC